MNARKTIKQLRPRLRTVAPLTFWICVGYALVNFAIAFILFAIPNSTVQEAVIPIVNEIMNFQAWGVLFGLTSLAFTYGLIRNNWMLLKRTLTFALVMKLIWTYALVYLIVMGKEEYALAALWAFLSWVQAWTIVFFVPTIADSRHDVLPENGGDEA